MPSKYQRILTDDSLKLFVSQKDHAFSSIVAQENSWERSLLSQTFVLSNPPLGWIMKSLKQESSKGALKAERAWFFPEEKERGLQWNAACHAGASEWSFGRLLARKTSFLEERKEKEVLLGKRTIIKRT